MIKPDLRCVLALLCYPLAANVAAQELTFTAKGELQWSQTEPQARATKNWFNAGTGQLHYAEQAISLGPQYISVEATSDTAISPG